MGKRFVPIGIRSKRLAEEIAIEALNNGGITTASVIIPPCPVCGAKPYWGETTEMKHYLICSNDDCNFCGPPDFNKMHAVFKWNKWSSWIINGRLHGYEDGRPPVDDADLNQLSATLEGFILGTPGVSEAEKILTSIRGIMPKKMRENLRDHVKEAIRLLARRILQDGEEF